jgi:hypothetical protein
VLREVLSHRGEPAALFVDASDSAAMASAIAVALGDGALAARLRRAGDGLKTRYSAEAMVDHYVRIIEEAM